MARQIGHPRLHAPRYDFAPLAQVQRLQLPSRLDARDEPAAASRIEPVLFELHRDLGSPALHQRQKRSCQKVVGGRCAVVCSALDHHAAGLRRQHQCREDSLEHERPTTRRPHRKFVSAGAHLARRKGELGRAEHRSFRPRPHPLPRRPELRSDAGATVLVSRVRHAHSPCEKPFPPPEKDSARCEGFAPRLRRTIHRSESCRTVILSRRPPGGACGRSPPDRPAPPSRHQSACKPPEFHRSHLHPSGTPRLRSSACDPLP